MSGFFFVCCWNIIRNSNCCVFFFCLKTLTVIYTAIIWDTRRHLVENQDIMTVLGFGQKDKINIPIYGKYQVYVSNYFYYFSIFEFVCKRMRIGPNVTVFFLFHKKILKKNHTRTITWYDAISILSFLIISGSLIQDKVKV